MKKSLNYLQIKDTLTKVLIKAGELIMEDRNLSTKTSKKEKNEIVTTTDLKVNNLIIENLQKDYPEIPIYSEENKNNSSDETRWIVDPIDGTTPWVWGNSGFSISIALEKFGEIVVGSVYDPVFKELFYAEKDKGSTLNNQKISPSNENNISKMLLVVDWGNSDKKREEGLEYYKNMMLPEMISQRIVPQFSPALGLCKIAQGRIHGLICNDTWLEDHSAGGLILQEAGGYCTNFYNQKKFDYRENGIIAMNTKNSHKKIINHIKYK